MGRRVGNWQYDPRVGWRLDGTDLVLDFDSLDRGGPLRGAYVLSVISRDGKVHRADLEAVDHYLGGAMAHVEAHASEYA